MNNMPSPWLIRSRRASNLFSEVHSHLAEIRELYTERSRAIVGVIEALFLPEWDLFFKVNSNPYENETEREMMLKYMGMEYPTKKNHVEVHEGFTAPGKEFETAVVMFEVERMQWVLEQLESMPDAKLLEYYQKALELEIAQKARK